MPDDQVRKLVHKGVGLASLWVRAIEDDEVASAVAECDCRPCVGVADRELFEGADGEVGDFFYVAYGDAHVLCDKSWV